MKAVTYRGLGLDIDRKNDGIAIKGIGINADASRLDGNLDTLRRDLEYFYGLGVDCVEIPVHGVGAMIGGRLQLRRVEELRRVLDQFPFRYTVHSPNPLNLMDMEDPFWQKQAFRASLEFAAAVGSQVLVYHSGRYLPEECFHLTGGRPELTSKARAAMVAGEREALVELAAEAERLGVVIVVENARPYLDGSPYCYGEDVFQLVDLVASIRHPFVGIALDVGHAYLASRYYGFDLLKAVSAALPHIRHVHLHDNFGRVCGSLEKKQAELLATGRGDLHLPIGLGDIPVESVLSLVKSCPAMLVHEIRPRYIHLAEAALEMTKWLCPHD